MLRTFVIAASAALTLGVAAIGFSAPLQAFEGDGGGSAYRHREHRHGGWDDAYVYRRHGWDGERRGWDGQRDGWDRERHGWNNGEWDNDGWRRHGWRGYDGGGRRFIDSSPPPFWGSPPRPPIDYRDDGYTAY